MIKTKLYAIMLCLLYALIFSGCAGKTVYITQKCEVEKPARLYNDTKCAKTLSDFEFAKCILAKTEALKADYKRLNAAFEACR